MFGLKQSGFFSVLLLRWQESLPKLPVPDLEQTAARYIQSLKPLLKPDELENSKRAVTQFLKKEGPELQQKLIARSQEPGRANWLSEWWDYNAYMAYRDPVVFNVSYFYSHKDDRTRKDQAARAAALSTGVLAFRKQVIEGTLEPEYMKKLPICMDSYKYMFNACRLPQQEADYVKMYPTSGDSEFILVMRKGRFFKVPHTKDGEQLSTADLQQQFQKVLETATSPANVPIGALTSENRDKWLEAREVLLKSNKQQIEDIEKSSFVVCLDEGSPITYEDRARTYWHGDGLNRYFDKETTKRVELGGSTANGEPQGQNVTVQWHSDGAQEVGKVVSNIVQVLLSLNKLAVGSDTIAGDVAVVGHSIQTGARTTVVAALNRGLEGVSTRVALVGTLGAGTADEGSIGLSTLGNAAEVARLHHGSHVGEGRSSKEQGKSSRCCGGLHV